MKRYDGTLTTQTRKQIWLLEIHLLIKSLLKKYSLFMISSTYIKVQVFGEDQKKWKNKVGDWLLRPENKSDCLRSTFWLNPFWRRILFLWFQVHTLKFMYYEKTKKIWKNKVGDWLPRPESKSYCLRSTIWLNPFWRSILFLWFQVHTLNFMYSEKTKKR